LDNDAFEKIVKIAQTKFVSLLKKKPAGTALNEALCENTFTLAVCVSNRIPVFVR
jgi:hypothetical protein